MSEDNDFRKFGSLQCKYFDCGVCKTNGKKCGKATNEIDNCIRLYKAEYNLIKYENMKLKKVIEILEKSRERTFTLPSSIIKDYIDNEVDKL